MRTFRQNKGRELFLYLTKQNYRESGNRRTKRISLKKLRCYSCASYLQNYLLIQKNQHFEHEVAEK